MHGEGGRRRQVQLMDSRPDIPGDTRDGGVHCRHDALSCLAALPAVRAEPCVLGNRTTLLEAPSDSSGQMRGPCRRTPRLKITTLVGMANATEALSALRALRSEALVRTTGRCECLRGVLQAHGGFGGPARLALFGRVIGAVLVSAPPFELFHGGSDGLVCRPRFRGHGTGDGFAQRGLPMEQVRCVVGLQRVFHRGQQPGRFIARRLDHPAMELCQGRRQACIPCSVDRGPEQLCHNNTVVLRVHRDQAKAAC